MARPPKNADPATPTTQTARPKANAEGAPYIARAVLIHIESTAKLGGLDVVALHRIPLLRQKLAVDGEVRLIGEWPDGLDRRKDMTAADVAAEHRRMCEIFVYERNSGEDGRRGDVVDLVTDFYGPPASSRLVPVMRKLDQAFAQLEAELVRTGAKFPTPAQLEDVLALAGTEHDFDGGIPFETPAEAPVPG
jgi:hypothetical protein